MRAVFQRHRPDAVVHFAAFKAVGESVAQPLAYYRNNLGGLVNTCELMREAGCSAWFQLQRTVYGVPERLPLHGTPRLGHQPYGQTKLMGEQILRDPGRGRPAWQTACLRYFNPVGAHESGRIGEDPRGTPNNLMPYVAQVAVGRREQLAVFGNDYPPRRHRRARLHPRLRPGRGPRRRAARLLDAPRSITVNLAPARATACWTWCAPRPRAAAPVPYEIVARRPGDVAACWADPALPPSSSAGAPFTAWPACAKTAGAGRPTTPTDSRNDELPSTRHHGRRFRHSPVAAVARRLPKQFLVLSGNAKPLPARRQAPGWTWPAATSRSLHRHGRRQRGAPLPGARPTARGQARPEQRACSNPWGATRRQP